MKTKKPSAKSGNPKFTKGKAQDMTKKRKWVPEQKVFKGNIKEGTFFIHTQLSLNAVTRLFVTLYAFVQAIAKKAVVKKNAT